MRFLLLGIMLGLASCGKNDPPPTPVQRAVSAPKVQDQTNYTVKFQDKTGRYLGRETTRGDTSKFYDKTGRYMGQSKDRSGVVTYYDKTGKIVGRAKIQK